LKNQNVPVNSILDDLPTFYKLKDLAEVAAMGAFWLKTAIVLAIVLAGGILVVNFLSSGVEHATDFEKTERLMEEQDRRLDAELEEAEEEAGALAQQPPAPRRPAPEQDRTVETVRAARQAAAEMTEADRVAAERLYQMAYTEYKMGRLPTTTFKKMVDYCRELFERYPDSPQAAKARILMKKLPQRFKDRYNVTDEEMGL
jgi:hypothetical protein